MSDQAQGLRALADQTRREQSSPSFDPTGVPAASSVAYRGQTPGRKDLSSAPLEPGVAVTDARLTQPSRLGGAARVIAITSGKGGVGKTSFTTNLALTLARSGERIIIVDADLGLANLHVMMGVRPKYDLEHVMRGQKAMRDVLYPGPCGVLLIGGGSGITELANLDEATCGVFLDGLRTLDALADVILIDTGAGLSRNVMAFLCSAQEIIVVTTPEPTALTDAYATIKVITRDNPTARLRLVVNMARSEAEAVEVADRLIHITRRFLGAEPDFLGFLPLDATVAHAVRSQQPFTLSFPESAASRSIAAIATRLDCRPVQAEEPPASGGFGDLLGRMQRFFTGKRGGAFSRR